MPSVWTSLKFLLFGKELSKFLHILNAVNVDSDRLSVFYLDAFKFV